MFRGSVGYFGERQVQPTQLVVLSLDAMRTDEEGAAHFLTRSNDCSCRSVLKALRKDPPQYSGSCFLYVSSRMLVFPASFSVRVFSRSEALVALAGNPVIISTVKEEVMRM